MKKLVKLLYHSLFFFPFFSLCSVSFRLREGFYIETSNFLLPLLLCVCALIYVKMFMDKRGDEDED